MTQAATNGLIATGIYVLAGMSFAIVAMPTRTLNLAHGAMYTVGAYLAFLTHATYNIPLCLAMPVSVVLTAATGATLEAAIFGRLWRQNAGASVLLLVSLGVYIALQSVVALIFGEDVRMIRSGELRPVVDILGGRMTTVQIATSEAAVISIGLCWYAGHRTKLGKAFRAVGANGELAAVSGVDVAKARLWAVAGGSGLAALTGILAGLDTDLVPTMGLHLLLMALVVVLLGGKGSILGLCAASLLLGSAQHLGVWKVSTQWQDAIAFAVLLIFLLVRPQGLFGRRVRKASV